MKRYDGVSAELAAVDGRKRLNMDKVMTVVCFVLLLIIVVIPIFMIIYNAFFYHTRCTCRSDTFNTFQCRNNFIFNIFGN